MPDPSEVTADDMQAVADKLRAADGDWSVLNDDERQAITGGALGNVAAAVASAVDEWADGRYLKAALILRAVASDAERTSRILLACNPPSGQTLADLFAETVQAMGKPQ